MFSKSCEYAIRALLYIVAYSKDRKKISIEAVSTAIDTPKHFTAKLLQSLSRQNIISSVKGPNGGFYIDPDAPEIPLMNVVEAIDGVGVFSGCALGLSECSEEHPCPLHHYYKDIRVQILKMLNEESIQQLGKKMEGGKVFVKNKGYLR